MMQRDGLFSSESVSAGHPDKICDRISDRFVDLFLTRDPRARVACETLAADGKIVVAGEFRTADRVDFDAIRESAPSIVRETLRDAGYRDAATDIDPDECAVEIRFNHQSTEIAGAVDQATGVVGAGDQGMMFGYASDETPQLMPLAISLAHALLRRLRDCRDDGTLPFVRADAKSQVTVQYRKGRPAGIDTVVLSLQHDAGVPLERLRTLVTDHVVDAIVPASSRVPGFKLLINPAGSWTVGGPKADTGVTGRKIIVDTYGGACPHGGGAFSGKDASKVDRSAAYAARWVAKHVVAGGLARRCTVQLAYAIGRAEPVSVGVDLHGTGNVDEGRLAGALPRVFDLTPGGIVAALDLTRPIFARTSAYGHFGRDDPAFTWERTPRIDELRRACA
jgi:S-adenosylmethionine synthetase